MKRLGAAIAFTVTAVAAAVMITSSSASAAGLVEVSLVSWAYLDSQNPGAKVADAAVTPPVGTSQDDAQRTHTYRSYFTYDLTKIEGAIVRSSYLATTEKTMTDARRGAVRPQRHEHDPRPEPDSER